jgi:hypothetical protein
MKWFCSLLLFFTLSFFGVTISYAQPEKCPSIHELKETSVKDRDGLLKALQKIVPQTYDGELGEFYTDWRLKRLTPFPLTIGNQIDQDYYGMAKNFCGKDIADRSWLARIYFPKWEGKSASNLEGQLFLAKSKEKGWFVWFRYH